MAKSLIFGKDLHKEILCANTPQKAKNLARRIKKEFEKQNNLLYLEGVRHGFRSCKDQITEVLNKNKASVLDGLKK